MAVGEKINKLSIEFSNTCWNRSQCPFVRKKIEKLVVKSEKYHKYHKNQEM